VLLIPKRHRQTDGRTDRQTDGRLTVALPRSALASRGKNNNKLHNEQRYPIPPLCFWQLPANNKVGPFIWRW